MLVRFSVSNFLSFNEQQIFSMIAAKHTRHKNHIFECAGRRLLKGSVIYGANASGKTNLIKAIRTGRDLALSRIDCSDLFNCHFRIDSESREKPGVFQFDFYTNGHFYSYGFAISYAKQQVEKEWLYKINKDSEEMIFERDSKEGIKTDLSFASDDNKNRFLLYGKDVSDKKTFLSELYEKKLNEIKDFDAIYETGDWFSNLIFVFPQTRLPAPDYYTSNESRTNLERMLRYFDTGVESIIGEETNPETALSFLPNSIRDDIIKDIAKTLANRKAKKLNEIYCTISGKSFKFKMVDGEITTSRLVMNHGNGKDCFDIEDESDGTKRLFDLIPIFKRVKGKCVVFIDELDRSFHTKLTIEFLKKYFEESAECQSQLIATLHDANVMDLSLLRQDEIWFVERNNKHASEVFSLNKFKERYDKDVAKDYILGRYGAIPCFSDTWREDDE